MKEWVILLVDEKPSDILSLKKCFSNDYQAISAQTGAEALKKLETNEVDIILSSHCFTSTFTQ